MTEKVPTYQLGNYTYVWFELDQISTAMGNGYVSTKQPN